MKTYEAPDDAEAILQRIAYQSNSTPGEVLSEAVAYFDVLYKAHARGKKIVITDKELLNHWMGKLGKCERTLLGVIYDVYPNAITKDELEQVSGYSQTSSGFQNSISTLRTLELIGRGAIVASETFFE